MSVRAELCLSCEMSLYASRYWQRVFAVARHALIGCGVAAACMRQNMSSVLAPGQVYPVGSVDPQQHNVSCMQTQKTLSLGWMRARCTMSAARTRSIPTCSACKP